MIKLFIVEDHKILRDGLTSMLAEDPEIKVVGNAANGKLAIAALKNENTDLVLMDINMPEMNGIETCRLLTRERPEIKVLILTMLDHENYVHEVFKAGAKAYLLKNIGKNELLAVIKNVYNGESYLSPEIASTLAKKLQGISEGKAESKISKRELEVLKLIAEGLTNKEIADKLNTSDRTIEAHRRNLMDKTNSKNTATLIKYAVKSGLVS